jgi:hypothetical protein
VSRPPPVLAEWLRDVLLALGAFVGGRSLNALTEAHKDRLQLRDSVTRLAIGVESISGDLRDIRGEINKQVGELKVEIHEQVSGLKAELHQQQANHDQRMAGVEMRIDGVNTRIDAIAASEGVLISRPRPPGSRLEWERRCPPMAPEEEGTETAV